VFAIIEDRILFTLNNFSMKKISFLTLVLVFIFISACQKSEDVPTPMKSQHQTGSIAGDRSYTLVQTAVGGGGGGTVSLTCNWSDGFGGNMNCGGDNCSVMTYTPPEGGPAQHGIGCFQGTTLLSSDLWRL
jgi:hypothetical protein